MTIKTWGTTTEACKYLAVSEITLTQWREIGYLKNGTHWRVSSDHSSNLHSEFIYHLSWCKEEMDYWRAQDACINHFAA